MRSLLPTSYFLKPRKGFTFFELMVVIGIVVVISAVAVTNFRGGGNVNLLQSRVKQLASDIRLMQSKSLGGEVLSDGTFPAGGYGVALVRKNGTNPAFNAYYLYVDRDASGRCETCAAAACQACRDGDSSSCATNACELLLNGKNSFPNGTLSLTANYVSPDPREPALFGTSANCTSPESGWHSTGRGVFITFVPDGSVVVDGVSDICVDDEEVQLAGVRIDDENSTRKGYVYVSKQTGVINESTNY